MSKKGGLGSGLSALFGDDLAEELENTEPTSLAIEKIEPRRDQPRKQFDEDSLSELAESIRKYGLIQPITVRPLDNGYYQIIAGERRWRAARNANLSEIPVRIIEADDRMAMELALVENLQREDLNPIEEAKGYRTLMDEYGLTQEEAASAVGKSRPAIANALRLLSLCASVLEMVENGELSSGHARALIPIEDQEKQLDTANYIINKHLSVRQTEILVKRLLKPVEETKEEDNHKQITINYIKEVERELENALGRKVKLVDGKNKGRIEIEFYGEEDREKLIDNLRLFYSLRQNK